jgi:hypothetical protein
LHFHHGRFGQESFSTHLQWIKLIMNR